jgi:molybdopterin converting factor small subunit
MIVTVHLHTILQRQTPDGPVRELRERLPEGTTLTQLMERMGVRLDPDALLLVVNGRLVQPDCILSDGDEVHLMPALSGGAGAGRR